MPHVLVPLEDSEDVSAAYAAKYGWPDIPPADRPPFRYFEVVARR